MGINGKYMVNFVGQERWYGRMFDTEEQAINEALKALRNKELDNDMFGEPLRNYTIDNMGVDAFKEKFFLTGIVRALTFPDDFSDFIIEWLDEGHWGEVAYEDERPSDYVFDDKDKEELSKLLKEWMTPKIEASNYYSVEISWKVPV